jgi:hypothetical protein
MFELNEIELNNVFGGKGKGKDKEHDCSIGHMIGHFIKGITSAF